MLDFSSLSDRFTDLLETTEVLIREAKKDFGRWVTAQTSILANMELFRRDSVLDKVNKKVSKASVNSLRSSTLLSSSMFEDSIVKEVQDSTERSIRFGTSSTPSTRSFLQRALGVALLPLPLLLSSLPFGAAFEEGLLEQEEKELEVEVIPGAESLLPLESNDVLPFRGDLPPAPDPPPFLDQLPVGMRLGNCLSTWQAIQADPWTISLISRGLTLRFITQPLLSKTPTILSCYRDPDKQKVLVSLVKDMIEEKVVETVRQPDSPGFYNRLFLVPKKGGTWRPVIDLSCLNKMLLIPSFKMETVEHIMEAARQGSG